MTVADELIKSGAVTHAYLGLQAVPLPASLASRAGVDRGLVLTAVDAGGPAAAAGLQPGDVLTDIDGQRATTTLQLTAVGVGQASGRQGRRDVPARRPQRHRDAHAGQPAHLTNKWDVQGWTPG